MPFSARALKENIFFDVDIVVKKHKNVKIEIWFIVVCTLVDNEYASLLFSQTFRIVSVCQAILQRFLKGKSDAYKELICIMQRVHFSSSPSRCFQLSTNLGKDFFRYL